MKVFLGAAAAFVLLAAIGCGGPPRGVRTAIEHAGEGLDLADGLVEDAVRDHGEEARAQVIRERSEGTIAGADVEEVVRSSLERFEELMEPTNLARRALRAAMPALRALEATVDSWAAGTGDGAGFVQIAACVGVALASVVDALAAAELELPELLRLGASSLQTFATSACAGGD